MKKSNSSPEINISKIPVGAGVAGVIFTLGTLLIFLFGVPGLWGFFGLALALGLGIAVVLRLTSR